MAQKTLEVAPSEQYHSIYKQTYRVQAGGLWRNQQLVDNYFRQQSAPIPWIFNIFPMQWHDRRCSSILQDSHWGSWDGVDKEIGTEFTFLGVRHKWVDHDQYTQLTGLPYRLPDVPVGRVYLPEMHSRIEEIRQTWEIAPPLFEGVITHIKNITHDNICSTGFVAADNTALDILAELVSGFRPQFINEIEDILAKILTKKAGKYYELDTPKLTAVPDDWEQNIFSVQEQLFTAIFNLVAKEKVREVHQSDVPYCDAEKLLAQKFYDLIDHAHVGARAVAFYGLIALNRENKSDKEMLEAIEEQLRQKKLPDGIQSKTCSKARQVYTQLRCIFEPPEGRASSSNNIKKMDLLLISVLKKIAEENYKKSTFGL